MKKRIGAIVALALLTVFMTTSVCFAGTLEITDSYPRNEDKSIAVENSGVKLYFNQNMISKNHEKINAGGFKLTDSKGKEIPTRVLYSPKEKGLVLVLVDNKTLESDSKYKLWISSDIESAKGDKLGKDQTIEFNTIDTSTAVKANMIMMGVMMIGIIWASSRTAKRQEDKEKKEAIVDEKVNPYKVAKETGKSVEDVIAETEKEKEKQRRKMERKLARGNNANDDDYDDEDEIIDNGNKKVKSPRPISAGGSTYITGRKAEAEEAARRKAAAGTTKPKNKGGKKKK